MAKRIIGVCYGAVKDDYQALIKERAEALGFEAKFLASDEFASPIPEGWLEDCEVVFGNIPVSRLPEAKNLKWLQTSSAGVAQYCAPGALPESIMLTNASGGYGVGISEYMVAQMLALLKRFPEYMENQCNRVWRRQGMVGAVTGLKVTVVGLGDIGGAFAYRAHLLGARVTGVKRTLSPKPDYIERLFTTDQLDEALKDADLVALALPGIKDTAGLLNRERIFALKQGCYIINVGRGDVLDEQALVEALNSGYLGGAGLDVFVKEPLPEDSPLWTAKNAILTPHVSGGTTFALTVQTIIEIFIENLEAYAADKPFKRTVNRELGY
jgi:phosphoglycerate dehydrogenase-like enzyme